LTPFLSWWILSLLRRLALLGALLFAVGVADSTARGSFPGSNGAIAFVRGSQFRNQIWVVLPDGTGTRPLTRSVPYIWVDGIAWSPGGSRLLFVHADGRNCGIPCFDTYVVRPDGTGLARANLGIGGTGTISGDPAWSPGGIQVAASTYRGDNLRYATYALDVSDINTGKTRTLAPAALRGGRDVVLAYGYDIGDYAWSPNGEAICFSRAVGKSRSRLALVRADGSQLRLIPRADGFDCSWSPDSKRIAYTDGRNLWSMSPDGSGRQALTSQTAREVAPVWSPDGSTIAFLRQESGANHPAYDLWTMKADGSAETMIAANVSRASWSPDGTMVALIKGGRPPEDPTYKNEPKPEGLWVAHSDGSGQLEIAKGATEFDWQALHS